MWLAVTHLPCLSEDTPNANDSFYHESTLAEKCPTPRDMCNLSLHVTNYLLGEEIVVTKSINPKNTP